MSRTPTAAQVLGRVVLVTGKEEFLSERTVGSVRDAVRAHDPEAEIGEAAASDLTLATLGEMAAPSLFSTTRCVVVRGLENLPDESVAGLLDYAGAPAEDIALVLVHGGGPKGSGVLTKLRTLAAVAHQLCNDFPGEPISVDKVKRYFGGRAEATSFAVADAAFSGRRE